MKIGRQATKSYRNVDLSPHLLVERTYSYVYNVYIPCKLLSIAEDWKKKNTQNLRVWNTFSKTQALSKQMWTLDIPYIPENDHKSHL